MTWIKLEDTLPDHDRAVRAGSRAMWLWVCALCWCSRHLTDGRVPEAVIPRLIGEPDALDLAQVLVDVGLFSRTRTGFTIKRYADYQRTKEEVEHDREKTRERAKRHRAKRNGNGVTNANVTDTDTDTDTDSPPTPPDGGLNEPSWLMDENEFQVRRRSANEARKARDMLRPQEATEASP